MLPKLFKKRSGISIRKDYHDKKFINPYFNHKKAPSRFNTKLYIKILLAIFLVYLVVYSDLLKVKQINISGLDLINRQEFTDKIQKQLSGSYLFIFPKSNILFIKKSSIDKAIRSSYSLNQLIIKKGWQKLNIQLEEKISFLIVKNNDKYFFTDAEGNITREIASEELAKYQSRFPMLFNNANFSIGDNLVSARTVNYIINLDNLLKTKHYKVSGYEVGGVDEIIYISDEGWRAKFDLNSNTEQAIENMTLILSQKIKDRKKLDYIDLRAGDKIFYKPK